MIYIIDTMKIQSLSKTIMNKALENREITLNYSQEMNTLTLNMTELADKLNSGKIEQLFIQSNIEKFENMKKEYKEKDEKYKNELNNINSELQLLSYSVLSNLSEKARTQLNDDNMVILDSKTPIFYNDKTDITDLFIKILTDNDDLLNDEEVINMSEKLTKQ